MSSVLSAALSEAAAETITRSVSLPADLIVRLGFFATCSRQSAPITNIPDLPAQPIPIENDKGIEITNAHGQLTTIKLKALYIHVVHDRSISFICTNNPTPGGIIAIAIASPTTIGVYTFANLDIKVSASDESSDFFKSI